MEDTNITFASDNYTTSQSRNWLNWVTKIDLKTCLACLEKHGKIYHISERILTRQPLHPNCHCAIKAMVAVLAGYGTKELQNGADWWLKNYGCLPDYYMTYSAMKELGWKDGKSPAKYAPDKMMTRGIYKNKDRHLPDAPGRIWYEADINYYSGRRNRQRILWSNDGLIFITLDHYMTFIEII